MAAMYLVLLVCWLNIAGSELSEQLVSDSGVGLVSSSMLGLFLRPTFRLRTTTDILCTMPGDAGSWN